MTIYIDTEAGTPTMDLLVYSHEGVNWTASAASNTYRLKWGNPTDAAAFAKGTLSLGPCTSIFVDRGDMPQDEQWYSMELTATDSNGHLANYSQNSNTGGVAILPASTSPCNKDITIYFSGVRPPEPIPTTTTTINITNDTDTLLTIGSTTFQSDTYTITTQSPSTYIPFNWNLNPNFTGFLYVSDTGGVIFDRGLLSKYSQRAATATVTVSNSQGDQIGQVVQDSNQSVQLPVNTAGGSVDIHLDGKMTPIGSKVTIENFTNRSLKIAYTTDSSRTKTIEPGNLIEWIEENWDPITQERPCYNLNWEDSSKTDTLFYTPTIGISKGSFLYSNNNPITATFTLISDNLDGLSPQVDIATSTPGKVLQIGYDHTPDEHLILTLTGIFPELLDNDSYQGSVAITNNTNETIYIDTAPQLLVYPSETISWSTTDDQSDYSLRWGNDLFASGFLKFGSNTLVSVDRGDLPWAQQWYTMDATATGVYDTKTFTESVTQNVNGSNTLLHNGPSSSKSIHLTFSGIKPQYQTTINITNNTDATLNDSISPGATWSQTTTALNHLIPLVWSNQNSTRGYLNINKQGEVTLDRGPLDPTTQDAVTADMAVTVIGIPGNIPGGSLRQDTNKSITIKNGLPIGAIIDIAFNGAWPITFNAKVTVANQTNQSLTVISSDSSATLINPGTLEEWPATTNSHYTLVWQDGSQGTFSVFEQTCAATPGQTNLIMNLASIAKDPKTGEPILVTQINDTGETISLTNDMSHDGQVILNFWD